jgi:hypothetical protein
VREYKSAERNIESEYESARASCDPFAGNAKNICMAVAKGRKNVAKAELEARYKPGEDANYKLNITKATADYDVASEKCNDKAGNIEDDCKKEAKAVLMRAKYDAKSQLKTTQAIETDNDQTIDAHMRAKAASEDARREAAVRKSEANYAVEKCATSSGTSKAHCESEAKLQYGQ